MMICKKIVPADAPKHGHGLFYTNLGEIACTTYSIKDDQITIRYENGWYESFNFDGIQESGDRMITKFVPVKTWNEAEELEPTCTWGLHP
jgi:hypothetical protein